MATKKSATKETSSNAAERCRALGLRLQNLVASAKGSKSVFGSTQHEWKLAPPLSASALKALEKRLGVALPEEAHLWLSTVASSGAGPAYGLMKMAVPKGASAAKSFLSTKKSGASAFDGCVRVADQGCGMTDVLVVSGKNRGQVWVVLEGGARRRHAPDFLAWIEDWLNRAALEWAASNLFAVVSAGKKSAVIDDLRPLLEAAVAEAGDNASENALLVLCWMRAADRRFDDALALGDRAAAAFVDSNADQHDDDDLKEQQQERDARRHLFRARLRRLQGKKREALVEVDAGLAIEHKWASTRDELQAERALCR